MPLHPDFLARPLAHRALHNLKDGRPENSRAAVRAAITNGYGIEIDLQLSADDQAMVFHDYSLDRLTGRNGAIRQVDAQDLGKIDLLGGHEGIPTYAEILEIVAGRVPVLVEIKDQDGALGQNVGALERAAAKASQGYAGPLAFMSFNPHSMIALGEVSPGSVRGLTTCTFSQAEWGMVPSATRLRLKDIPDLDASGASFISHNANDLTSAAVAQVKSRGLPVLCWTIRSPEKEAEARKVADNITFEGYLAS